MMRFMSQSLWGSGNNGNMRRPSFIRSLPFPCCTKRNGPTRVEWGRWETAS